MLPRTIVREAPIRTIAAPLLFLLALAACSDITVPGGSERFEPPPAYRLWWRMTQECSGRTGRLDDVRWYVVPGARTVRVGRNDVAGYWSSSDNTIVLAGESWMDGGVVRHEMLHALLFGGDHPRSLFLGTCGGVVACNDACIDDAGPPPPPPAGAVHVPPDSIEIGLEINPPAPGGPTLGGYFTLTVTARNRASHAVIVDLPENDGAHWRESFAWWMRDGARRVGESVLAYDPAVTYFEPGETKREVFDCHVNGDDDYETIPPGSYAVGGSYGGNRAAAQTLTLAP